MKDWRREQGACSFPWQSFFTLAEAVPSWDSHRIQCAYFPTLTELESWHRTPLLIARDPALAGAPSPSLTFSLRGSSSTFSKSSFQPQFTFNTISQHFQMYSKAARKPCTLSTEWFPATPGSHLTPYPFISVLLTIFPMLQCTSLGLFCNYQFVLSVPLPSDSCQSVLCIYEFLLCLIILFIRVHI